VAYYSPGPKTAPPPFERCDDLWTAISRHPGSRSVTSVSLRRMPTHRVSIHSTKPPTLSRRSPRRARPPFTRTATLLGALRACLFETRHRLTTSATALRRTGNQTGALASPCRDDGHDRLPFLRASRGPFWGGDTWQAAHSSVRAQSRCRFLLVHPGLPDRDTKPTAPPLPAFDRTEFSGV
jgi:hypothetical protein